MSLTDTHCHLDFSRYDQDREFVLDRAWDAGLERILNPGIDLQTSSAAVNLARENNRIYAAVGVHPNSTLTWDPYSSSKIESLIRQPKVVAIGEIGLDYYRDRAPKDKQQDILCQQLELAEGFDLPVVVHTRNKSLEDRSCITDLIAILSEWGAKENNCGVVHSYSGNQSEATKLISLGFYIGITGPITYKNARSLRELVSSIPIQRLLIETDGPFLTPHPHRGKRNEPAFVKFVAKKIAEILDCSWEFVADQTSKNAQKLFQWKE